MFVNPGEVTVRDKQYQEDVIYDKVNHIYNSSLKNKSTNFNNKYNKSSSKSRSSLSSNASYSKSDDETLSTLDETKCDDNNLTKSDGEDSGTPNKNENGTVDYRKLFLQNIHNAARRNKEKEIEAYVQEYKEEMRKNHRKKFGPYDDEDNNSKYNKSPSKSSTTGSTTTNTNTTSTSSSPSRSSINNTPNKSSSNNNKSNEQKRSRSHSPRSPANDYDKDKDGENNNKPKSGNKQILNVLNSLTLSKLNGFNHRNGISIDMNTSNYGKHLKQILNSCKIHTRNQLQNDNRNNNNNKHKNGTILNNHHNNSNTKNGKINNSNKLNIDNDDYMLTMNGEYPSLFPMSFASPSPSISPMITPSPSPLDLDDGPQQLKHSKSQPITSDNNNRINNHYQPLQSYVINNIIFYVQTIEYYIIYLTLYK